MKASETIGLLGFFAFVGCLAYQSFLFLKYGMWVGFDLVDVGLMLNPSSQWLHSPDSWNGLHKVLTWINAGLAIFLTCSGVGLALAVNE